ncbi:hypothetical protein KOM00_07310 [Geomonas sp. Red69]|uniref:DUF6714 family protein n=1 Tax=Geomonas diazotrophica TaxID=2843197 RepID=UPI001C1173C8|nr:DUF6714 family protein [Geomonas diazotrophica]MBU5636543.1 hypothetical protein [Geomonas diazotrophica]
MDSAEVIEQIRAAFAGVTLEDGIGILESDAIDGCVSDKKREQARNNDYRENWETIPDEVIAENYSALCFMDPKGLRFNLPAYMIFALKNYRSSASASVDAPIYALQKEPEELEQAWKIFTKSQREGIANFLKFMIIEVGEKWVDSWQASLAYEKTWFKYDRE